MAIHEVLEGHPSHDDLGSPSFKRKGSPEESLFAEQASSSSSRHRHSHSHSYQHGSNNHSHANTHTHTHNSHRLPHSPRLRQESPLPASNSEEDEENTDIRNYKKRRTVVPGSHSSRLHKTTTPLPSPGIAPAEVMDQVRTTLKLKQQQKAIIEARQNGSSSSTTPPSSGGSSSAQAVSTSASSTSPSHPSSGSSAQRGPSANASKSISNSSASSNSNQPVTEKNTSGISVFHGSASFAAMSRRGPLVSPRNPKNAKSLTIFAPSYSESSLSIHSAPLQPSHAHQLMSGSRTSNPLRNNTPHHPHPLSHQHHPQQHSVTTPHSAAMHRPLRSPTTSGHGKSSSRVLLRGGPHTAGLDNSTLPAPILSSHTGPLPSPMYPHPSTPYHPAHSSSNLNVHLNSHGMQSAAAASASASSLTANKAMFMETVSTLFDSVDSSRSLKLTLEEQIRKSAQLLQTLQSSGTMIESLVRGQFKELEKGVLDRFESEIEYLSTRVELLEKHQGLTPPPAPVAAATTTPVLATQSTAGNSAKRSTTIRFATSGNGSSSGNHGHSGPSSLPSPPSASNNNGHMSGSSPLRHSQKSQDAEDMKDGTLPTPPLNKKQDSLAMEVEEEEEIDPRRRSQSQDAEDQSERVNDEDETMGEEESSHSASSGASPPSSTPAGDYHASVKKLQERIAKLEKGHEAAAAAAAAASVTSKPEQSSTPLAVA
ncbi:hypothetical protein BGZ83_006614 [Gryganskiella cystojenkinii]|nr:hypothetical protein BGZ83_006614 [Gryganskiella cystojenkinii]